jgi:hypothetical protein
VLYQHTCLFVLTLASPTFCSQSLRNVYISQLFGRHWEICVFEIWFDFRIHSFTFLSSLLSGYVFEFWPVVSNLSFDDSALHTLRPFLHLLSVEQKANNEYLFLTQSCFKPFVPKPWHLSSDMVYILANSLTLLFLNRFFVTGSCGDLVLRHFSTVTDTPNCYVYNISLYLSLQFTVNWFILMGAMYDARMHWSKQPFFNQ